MVQTELETAQSLDSQGRDACVDWYYRSAIGAWRWLQSRQGPATKDADLQQAWQAYHSSLSLLINAGQRHARLDPRRHLVVIDGGRRRLVPIIHHGFAWHAADFCQLLRAEDFEEQFRGDYYRGQGVGARLIAVRVAAGEDAHYRERHPFAATAVLRPLTPTGWGVLGEAASSYGSGESVLELYNPHVFSRVACGAGLLPLERDLSAPWAFVSDPTPAAYLEGFFSPFDAQGKPKLLMVEPYQRGKIPVVFIHGLLSDPSTWIAAGNEIQAQPDLYGRFQIWAFRYPTGGDVLESAAALREQLLLARERFDPGHQDPAMDRVVLVGHSMGGLLARLQASYAYETLWQHVAQRPLEAVRASPAVRNRLQRAFFFDPAPTVTRVVFIGTPHRGSAWARRVISRVGSNLVRLPGAESVEYSQLVDANRDVFYPYLWDSPPTSIDLLDPASPLLQAMALMPVSPRVRLHSIIGTGGGILAGVEGDGVVSAASARIGGVCSELAVPARHAQLHHDPATLAELNRILRLHAGEFD